MTAIADTAERAAADLPGEETLRRRAGTRGLPGAGGGRSPHVPVPPEFLATTVQGCGLYPFAEGGAAPLVGAPMGRRLRGSGAVCFDPISWFDRSPRLIQNPSVFVLGLTNFGKSSTCAHMAIGSAAAGVVPLFAGDLKPDYRDVTTRLGGRPVAVGRSAGRCNPCRLGPLFRAAGELDALDRAVEARALREEGIGRMSARLLGLAQVSRGGPLSEDEALALGAACRQLIGDTLADGRERVVDDLVALLDAQPAAVDSAVFARGDQKLYREKTDGLLVTLRSLTDSERFGRVFAEPSTHTIDLEEPAVCVDVSALLQEPPDFRAAALLFTWSEMFEAIEARQALVAAGLRRRRAYVVYLDEFWNVLASAPGMVDRVNEITRLNRNLGIGQVLISHSVRDLDALPEEDRSKARGYIERAGALLLGPLPPSEFQNVQQNGPGGLRSILAFSDAEVAELTSWASEAGVNSSRGKEGRFMLKVGNATGIPFQVVLTSLEGKDVLNTNRKWENQ
jgi:hypothetical protein